MSMALILKFIKSLLQFRGGQVFSNDLFTDKEAHRNFPSQSGVRAFHYSLSAMRHPGPSVGGQCLPVPAYLGVSTVGL